MLARKSARKNMIIKQAFIPDRK